LHIGILELFISNVVVFINKQYPQHWFTLRMLAQLLVEIERLRTDLVLKNASNL